MHLNLLFSDYSGTGFISGWLSGLSMALVEYPHLPITTEQMEMFSGRHSYICNTYRGKHLSSYCCCQQCCLSASGWTRLIFLWAVSERSIGRKLPKSCKNAIDDSGRKSSNAVNTLLKLLFLSLSVEILTKCLEKKIRLECFDHLFKKSVINKYNGLLSTWAALYTCWSLLGEQD